MLSFVEICAQYNMPNEPTIQNLTIVHYPVLVTAHLTSTRT